MEKEKEQQLLMVKEECKEVSVSSKRLAKKESHFAIKTNIKETSLLRKPPHFSFVKEHLLALLYLLSLMLFLK